MLNNPSDGVRIEELDAQECLEYTRSEQNRDLRCDMPEQLSVLRSKKRKDVDRELRHQLIEPGLKICSKNK